MENKLVKLVGKSPKGAEIGVLLTPCFPAAYYGGIINGCFNVYTPVETSSINYFNTEKEALDHAIKQCAKLY